MINIFNTRQSRSKKGFTLIELLVVIAIIGVLASIVLASLNTARRKARDTRRVADMNQVKLALELYFDSARSYPALTTTTGFVPNFIAQFPKDPTGTGGLDYRYQALVNDQGTACAAGTTCLYFHVGATVEDPTIPAMSADADRCPSAVTGQCTALTGTTIRGADTEGATAEACDDTTAAAGRGCYDVTP
ncbi:MAG: type II secretion system protein [Candidatus Sungbacteria bacterium]|nr:type II secretion system protein [Candidatus Sungbacteria bacterium]